MANICSYICEKSCTERTALNSRGKISHFDKRIRSNLSTLSFGSITAPKDRPPAVRPRTRPRDEGRGRPFEGNFQFRKDESILTQLLLSHPRRSSVAAERITILTAHNTAKIIKRWQPSLPSWQANMNVTSENLSKKKI